MTTATTESTRDRLATAAMRLFAEHGYAGTSVGQIEAEAGLAPRSGALYQYFKGKRELLDAAVERHVADLAEMQDAIDLLPLGDLRAELTLMARWNLRDLSRRRDLHRFLRLESGRFPELTARIYQGLGERPLRRVADYLRTRFAEAGVELEDAEALVVVMVQTMSAYRAHEDVYGAPALDVGEERFVKAWVDLCIAYARDRGVKGI
ncbi:MAG TPA: helix-turn-helix domain-containing protein [Thermoleophilaceae bacterium]|jgi:AcrR family transcriptional regulator